jgi:hypothetical protein
LTSPVRDIRRHAGDLAVAFRLDQPAELLRRFAVLVDDPAGG